MMNETEHLLVCLGEEASEIAQQTAKAVRFGLSDFEPGQPYTNTRRIEQEVSQLFAVFKRIGFRLHEEDEVEKNAKLDKYMKYSRQLGLLEQKVVPCDCLVPALEGAGQHSPTCAIFKAR